MKQSGVSPEFLLLAAVTRRPFSVDAISVRLGSQQIDWNFFFALALRHRVIGLAAEPLLAPSLASLVPEAARSRLENARRQAGIHELKMLSGLKRITDAFQTAGIEATLLKGLHLSARAYARMGLRTNTDIDLLVSRAEIRTAELCLLALGYHRILDGQRHLEPVEKFSWNEKDVSYFHPHDDIAVDLHWRLFHNPHLMQIEKLDCIHSEPIFNGINLRVLTPAANIVYLAAHGAIHAWSRLKWLADFQALLSRDSPEHLTSARKFATELGLTAPLNQALAMRAEIYGDDANMQPSNDFRVGFLKSVALLTMTRWGDREIEKVWGGTKLKNASHYFLRMSLAHAAFEAAYDIDGRVGPTAFIRHRKNAGG